jgi:hypothetical protein
MSIGEVILTEEELKDLCRKYQKILRLQDWKINVVVGRTSQETAYVRYNLNQKTAEIFITSTECQATGLRDMELDLVHEMVHLHLAPFVPHNLWNHHNVEFAVSALTEAVVGLNRAVWEVV